MSIILTLVSADEFQILVLRQAFSVTRHFMTNLLKIGLCFFFLSQTYEYNFNRRLTYEVIDLKNQQNNRIVTYLINEQDNSYNAIQNNILSTQNEIIFVDQNGIYWKGQIKTEDLNKPRITLEKEQITNYINPYKYQINNYDFIELKDTVLNEKVCKRFMLKSNDAQIEKKKKLGREIYVVDTSSNMKPMLIFATAYEIWKKRKNLPNGLIVEKYFFNDKREMIIKEKLKNSENINLTFNLSSK